MDCQSTEGAPASEAELWRGSGFRFGHLTVRAHEPRTPECENQASGI